MVELHEIERYYLEFKMKIIELSLCFTEVSIVRAMVKVEEYFRTRAILKTRSSHMIPWGKGLIQALSENADAWEEAKGYLVDKNQVAQSSVARLHARPSEGPGYERPQQAQTGVARLHARPYERPKYERPQQRTIPPWVAKAKQCTVIKGSVKTQISQGIKWYKERPGEAILCMHYNRSLRGCYDPDCGAVHACNAQLRSGLPCGMAHPRILHDDAVHGRSLKVELCDRSSHRGHKKFLRGQGGSPVGT